MLYIAVFIYEYKYKNHLRLFRYIYGGKTSLEEYDESNLFWLKIKNSMKQYFDLIYQASFRNDSFSKLQKIAKI